MEVEVGRVSVMIKLKITPAKKQKRLNNLNFILPYKIVEIKPIFNL